MAVCAGPAAAQRLWEPEIGMQAGYSHQKFAGTHTNNSITFLSVPGGNYLEALLGSSALFAVIPVRDRLAVEPQLAAMQANASITSARIGLRLDYAITPRLYAAAGGVLNYLSPGTPAHDQVGLQIALGYRVHLTGALNGRLEANWISMHDSRLLPAFNTYSLLAGFSTSLRSPNQSRRASGRANARWSPQLGISGGYTAAHRVGSGSLGGIFLPGSASNLTSFAGPYVSPPTLFAILPIGNRWAVEPSFDLHHIGGNGLTKVTALTAGARFDYAVRGGWYAGVGGQLAYVNPAAGSSGSILGATLAWGYRFHLAGALRGRFETSYTMSAKNDNLGSPPINTLGLLFGAMIPLR
jgi:hypothetical protein